MFRPLQLKYVNMLQQAEEMVLSNMVYCFIYRCKVGLFQRNMKELLYIVKKYFCLSE